MDEYVPLLIYLNLKVLGETSVCGGICKRIGSIPTGADPMVVLVPFSPSSCRLRSVGVQERLVIISHVYRQE